MRQILIVALIAGGLGLLVLGTLWQVGSMGNRSQDPLAASDQQFLLEIARQKLEAHLRGAEFHLPDEATLPAAVLRNAACFVTLTKDGQLRGCILDQFAAHEAIYKNVLRNVVLAATLDARFAPVRPEELPHLTIEISVLDRPRKLEYDGPEALLAALRPGVDGVILTTQSGSSTFLPQVWEQLPSPEEFLDNLCLKQGAPADCWREPPYPRIETYSVCHFAEDRPDDPAH